MTEETGVPETSVVTTKGEEQPFVMPSHLPVLTPQDLVVFPSVMVSLYVGRPSSLKAVKAALEAERLVFIAAQRDEDVERPRSEDLYLTGTIAHIIRNLELPDDQYRILVQGVGRARALKYTRSGGFLTAEIEAIELPDATVQAEEAEALVQQVRESLSALVEYEVIGEELLVVSEDIEDPGMLADATAAHLGFSVEKGQRVLEELDPLKRLEWVKHYLFEDLHKHIISESIRERAQDEMDRGQREFYLREQLAQIQAELGEESDGAAELEELEEQVEDAKLPKNVYDEAQRQLARLRRMSAETADAAVVRNHLEWIVELPWSNRTRDRLDLKLAQKVLDADHHGLHKVKDRILEFLSVRKLNKRSKGPILCLVGPPGVGKTSLGRSIAKALKRKFERLAVGGVRDEAEIRGHRRTYVGAMPGRIIQGLKQAGTKNPVFVIDELDKIGADFRGDPASALLEVLDPEQNRDFTDHFLGVPFDLSEIIFVATANTVDTIPEALLDRLEVIHIPGYTTDEKFHIAKRFLVPRRIKEVGLKDDVVKFTKPALMALIESYTREAGVRALEREIGSLLRKIARSYSEGDRRVYRVTPALVRRLLGPASFDSDASDLEDAVGSVMGLAWTVHGGELMEVEASIAPGSGELNFTGQLGEVMQESGRAAFFYARANAQALGVNPRFYEKYDFHVHVPEGATPKDGPSAGIAIVTALVSVLSGRKVSKAVAMTGEVTLRGRVLGVGGLKEKALAALRHGIKTVIMPKENVKDLEEISKEQRKQLTFIPVTDVSEVLEHALLPKEPVARKGHKRKTKKRLQPTRRV